MCVGYIQIQAILHKGLEHPWVLVFTEILVPIPLARKSVIWEQLDGRDASGKVCGKGHRACTWGHHLPAMWICSQPGSFWNLCHLGTMGLLHRHN